MKTKILIDF